MSTFNTKVGNDNQYYFNFKNADGKILLTSEGYTTVAARDNGIESVKKNLSNNDRYEHLLSSNGKYYFNIKASNGQVVAKSAMFDNEVDKANALSTIQAEGTDATIVAE